MSRRVDGEGAENPSPRTTGFFTPGAGDPLRYSFDELASVLVPYRDPREAVHPHHAALQSAAGRDLGSSPVGGKSYAKGFRDAA